MATRQTSGVRHAALFRGINVGKAKRIAMADLRTLLASLGYGNVRTLLNSGNVVFDADRGDAAAHAARIHAAVADTQGVKAMVIVKSAADVRAAVRANPFADEAHDPSRLLVAFTPEAAALKKVAALADGDWGSEALHVGRHAAYLWCADGLADSQLAVALLKQLDGIGTTRNWATTLKLDAMLHEPL